MNTQFTIEGKLDKSSLSSDHCWNVRTSHDTISFFWSVLYNTFHTLRLCITHTGDGPPPTLDELVKKIRVSGRGLNLARAQQYNEVLIDCRRVYLKGESTRIAVYGHMMWWVKRISWLLQNIQSMCDENWTDSVNYHYHTCIVSTHNLQITSSNVPWNLHQEARQWSSCKIIWMAHIHCFTSQHLPDPINC